MQIGLREVILHRPSEQPTEIVSEPIEVDTPLSWGQRIIVAAAWLIVLLLIWKAIA